jgi:hypothetical protein
MSGEESSRNASILLERTGFFVGKPPQNDRKKQASHYPVIAMERSAHCPFAVSRLKQAGYGRLAIIPPARSPSIVQHPVNVQLRACFQIFNKPWHPTFEVLL